MMYEYTTTFADFKNAQKLFARRSWRSRLSMVLWLWVAPAVGIISVALLVWDIRFRHFEFTPIIGGILAATAWLGLYAPAYRPFQLRKLYKQTKNGRPEGAPIEIGIEGKELISRVPGLSEGRFRRKAILEFIEDDHIALLVIRKKMFLLLPKTSLPDRALEEIRQ